MKINFHGRGDEDNQFRLLSFLRKQIPYEIEDCIPIRNHVFLIKSESGSFVLKGYSNKARLRLQEAFTTSLKNVDFEDSYEFHPLLKGKVLFYKNKHYGALQYLEPSDETFSYQDEQNRVEGLQLLSDFHQKTAKLVPSFSGVLGEFDLLAKWTERMNLFIKNMPAISYYLQPQVMNEIVSWAKFSVNGMLKHQSFLDEDETVILHGDVAHHNFLREKTGKLYLIDFDLISIGPQCCDYLQYANRILPNMDWSFEKLSSLEPLQKYLKNPGVIYALIFPTDIMREWNRLVRERGYYSIERINQVNDLTFRKIKLRQQFIHKLKNVVK